MARTQSGADYSRTTITGTPSSHSNGGDNGDAPGAAALGGVASHVPSPVSTFVGRDAERTKLSDVIAQQRLVTLCGPPGIGKTRLAAEVARDLNAAGGFPDGAWWVDLAAFDEPAAVTIALARAVGVHEQPGRSLLDAVIGSLVDRRALVVLDNCEHLVAAAASTAQAVLEGCAGMRVLATSREPLGLMGEWRAELGPLPPAEARELFCARAAAVYPVFDLNAPTAAAVHEICERLDGIPLAIELAAGRIGVLSATEIATHLDDRFAFFGAVQRSFWGRHQTLDEALSWSYDLLSEPEQTLLRRLGVFSGDFTFDAVKAICSGDDVDARSVVNILASLVSKSLVTSRTALPPARYRLLETIRAYAAERLAKTDEATNVAARHAAWYLAVTERAEPELTGSDQFSCLAALDADYDNIRTAIGWALEHDGDAALRMASSLAVYWRVRGRFSEARSTLSQALEHVSDPDAQVRAKGLWAAGFMALMMEDLAVAESLLDESLTLHSDVDHLGGQARDLLLLGNCRLQRRRFSEGLDLLTQSVALARETGDHWCLAHALALSGRAYRAEGNEAHARMALEEGLSVARQAHDPQGLRIGLILLGRLTAGEGDHRRAEELFEESIAVVRQLGEPYSAAEALDYLADLTIYRADHERARQLLMESLACARVAGSPDSVSIGLSKLGHLELHLNNLSTARRLLTEAVDTAGSSETARGYALTGLGALAMKEGDLTAARELLNGALGPTPLFRARAFMWPGLRALAALDSIEGHTEQAEARQAEMLEQCERMEDVPRTIVSLEELGELSIHTSRPERATRLLAAAASLRREIGYARFPFQEQEYNELVAAARQALPADVFEAAWNGGSALSVGEAVAYALGTRGQRPQRPKSGWASLTRAQREVARMVAAGLSNPEIARRRFVSVDTVKKHLRAAFSKLGVSSRVDLTKEVLRQSE